MDFLGRVLAFFDRSCGFALLSRVRYVSPFSPPVSVEVVVVACICGGARHRRRSHGATRGARASYARTTAKRYQRCRSARVGQTISQARPPNGLTRDLTREFVLDFRYDCYHNPLVRCRMLWGAAAVPFNFSGGLFVISDRDRSLCWALVLCLHIVFPVFGTAPSTFGIVFQYSCNVRRISRPKRSQTAWFAT